MAFSKEKYWKAFMELGQDGLVMTHYELEEMTRLPAKNWKIFLSDVEVNDWITSEIKMLQDSELKKIVKNISMSKSVGLAQVLTAMMKLREETTSKTGPIFIYNQTPLNPEQKKGLEKQ